MSESGEQVRPTNVVYQRFAIPGSSRFAIRAYRSNTEPDGTVIDGTETSLGDPEATLIGSLDVDEQRRPKITIAEAAMRGAPPLWFVEIPSERDGRQQLSLVAYASNVFPTGTIITNATFFSAPVKSEAQVGAVRWFADNGLVDQLFVADSFRNQLVAMSLMFAADGMHHHLGWSGVIHVGGNRTDLGQQAAQRALNQQRVAPWTQRSRLQRDR